MWTRYTICAYSYGRCKFKNRLPDHPLRLQYCGALMGHTSYGTPHPEWLILCTEVSY